MHHIKSVFLLVYKFANLVDDCYISGVQGVHRHQTLFTQVTHLPHILGQTHVLVGSQRLVDTLPVDLVLLLELTLSNTPHTINSHLVLLENILPINVKSIPNIYTHLWRRLVSAWLHFFCGAFLFGLVL